MLKGIRNSLVIMAVLYTVLGVVLMLFPGTALRWACALIGVVTLLYGLVRAAGYWKGGGAYNQRFDLFLGVVLVLLGIFLLVTPQVLVSVIPVTLGVYILVDSIAAVKRALDMKALGFDKWWISFLAAVLLAAFGVVMILRPFKAVESLVVFIGLGFVFDGVYTLANTIVADQVYKGRP